MNCMNNLTGSPLGAKKQAEQLREQSFNGVRFDASGLSATV
ncbi:hypothetical protein [Renibacterium salmoninarum]|nr:hypothetical protein [Renibacterium salmoninarum]